MSQDRSAEMPAYVGFKSCGCAVAAAVDDATHSRETAKFIGDLVRRGFTVERRTVGWVRDNLRRCVHGVAPTEGEG